MCQLPSYITVFKPQLRFQPKYIEMLVSCCWLISVCDVSSSIATAHSFGWPRTVGPAAGLRSASGPKCWYPVLGCALSVNHWWWVAASAVAGAQDTECWTGRHGGPPSAYRAVAVNGSWRHHMATAAVLQTTSSASYLSKPCHIQWSKSRIIPIYEICEVNELPCFYI